MIDKLYNLFYIFDRLQVIIDNWDDNPKDIRIKQVQDYIEQAMEIIGQENINKFFQMLNNDK